MGPMPWGDSQGDIEDAKVFVTYWEKENPAARPQNKSGVWHKGQGPVDNGMTDPFYFGVAHWRLYQAGRVKPRI